MATTKERELVRPTSKKTDDVEPTGTIQVFNHTLRPLSAHFATRPAGTNGEGSGVKTIMLTPGNNEVDAGDWKKCKKLRVVRAWLDKRTVHPDRVGKRQKMAYLEEDFFDKEFVLESKDLGDKIHEARSRQSGLEM